MSVSGINSSIPVELAIKQFHPRSEKFKQEFQQLGKDLQAGDLEAAQADFATLSAHAPAPGPSTQSKGALGQAFDRLTQDLQTGDLSAAKQDYATILQEFRARAHASHQPQPVPPGVNPPADLLSAQQAYLKVQNQM